MPGSSKVYPRPRGGAFRGIRYWLPWARSIPAHAGEPRRLGLPLVPHEGLSPPTRGSLGIGGRALSGQGSIPAHAGEPFLLVRHDSSLGVYPRPRGGAVATRLSSRGRRGLSPPTRGSHSRSSVRRDVVRSIPAHAGEPFEVAAGTVVNRVYPRPRGGAHNRIPGPVAARGLSPPTRGSQIELKELHSRQGSIPAHAGEPLAGNSSGPTGTVYPRPRGGANPA